MMQVLFNIIYTTAIYMLVSVSFSLIYYPVKFFHIAHAAIITLSAYLVYLFLNKFSFSLYLSIAFAILITIFIGIITEVLVYRQLRKKNVTSLSYFITAIGIYVVIQNCIILCFGNNTKIINTSKVSVGNQFFEAYITNIQIITILVSVVLFIFVNLFLSTTKTGKSIRAVASNSNLCNLYGISSNKVILLSFGLGSMLAAIAGILSAMNTNVTPNFGFNLFMYGIVAMIISGVGSTRSLIVGSLIVASAQHLSAFFLDTKWMEAATYMILILFLIWKPLGFSGKALKKLEV